MSSSNTMPSPLVFRDIIVGDQVKRVLAGTVAMTLVVREITETQIICGPWVFDRATGAEIDDDLDWGPPPQRTGSYLEPQE